MRPLKSLLLFVVIVGLLSGCGLSGPLYLEDGSQSIKPDAPEETEMDLLKKRNQSVS